MLKSHVNHQNPWKNVDGMVGKLIWKPSYQFLAANCCWVLLSWQPTKLQNSYVSGCRGKVRCIPLNPSDSSNFPALVRSSLSDSPCTRRINLSMRSSLTSSDKAEKLSEGKRLPSDNLMILVACWYILSKWILLIPNWCRHCILAVAPENDNSFFCHSLSSLSNCFPHTTCHWDVDPFVVTHGRFAAGFHVFKSTGCFLSKWMQCPPEGHHLQIRKKCSNSIHIQSYSEE